MSAGAPWLITIKASRHCIDRLQSGKVELAEGHEIEVDSLNRVIKGLRCHSEELQAELKVLRGREQQHLLGLEQAHESMLDLRQAAQQAEQSQASWCSAALEQAVSCRWRLVRLFVCFVSD